MTESLPFVSIIIATYHRNESLVNTITDVLNLDYPSYEILVIDQDPCHSPTVHDVLETWHKNHTIRWIQTPKPGLTRSRNIGITKSRGDLIIFVDDDVQIPDRQFLQGHVSLFLQNPHVGAVAGRVLEPGKKPLTVRRHIGWMGYSGMREPGFGSDFSAPAYSVRGCNMAFRKSALLHVGGFDERYTRSAFREDTDISFRIRKAGYAIWFNHKAWLYHLSAPHGGTRDESIAVESDIMLNDWRFALFNLSIGQQFLWIARLYASRVVKASLKRGYFSKRHRAFWQGYHQAKRDRDAGPKVSLLC
ncbi:glycosyltransferase family 2 protein [Sulfobacillus thermosulfidooxidans]|uniref:glycosyltransferase family 2 protein n=1 Tax=Sulfobacillus thermosulfidooxidans TaxID=28034 RepID=UPI00096BA63B|nr:glycosyltransferase family 2 protein [Sulfobacillus thermosulfidooxidans]OLZ11685.1 glycosyl transferase family 2 [Sulfobacillus thermosulfidooxidans]OLZ18648.1 glycosyl transferase family 2 [Sulfobacillus thermosulfidooxidans]OLZ20273.1 glycosyl transferase family 2 [Sulfobacillus thermosulfidooxidans]